MKKLSKKSIFIILAIVVVGFGVVVARFAMAPSEEEISENFITANPFDLTQIKGFSKYRGCEGHDYRAPTLNGQKEGTPRSMKHYVTVKSEFRGTTGEVDAFAPFDGEISSVEDEETSDDSQVWLTPNPGKASQWQFIFFHIKLDDSLGEGSPVTAGQHIGTANLTRGLGGATDNFDIALKFTRPLRQPAVDAPFKHATRNVLDEYEKYGVSVGELIISRKYRDMHPCPISRDRSGPDIIFSPGTAMNDYVWLAEPTK